MLPSTPYTAPHNNYVKYANTNPFDSLTSANPSTSTVPLISTNPLFGGISTLTTPQTQEYVTKMHKTFKITKCEMDISKINDVQYILCNI